jgi:sterol desaturase/sphingolipid hydroxylase (fatty acid hydroxylase superfamily)
MTLQRFFLVMFGITVETGLRYLLFAGTGWLLGYVFFRRRWWHRKVVQKLPESTDIRREIRYSLRTMVIFGVVGAVTLALSRAGWTQMYFQLSDHSWLWFWTSVVLAILVHDTWFYWTHRLLHHPRWFRWTHRAHHLSMNPSPWASYAFDPAEAVVQASIFPLVVSLMPIHPFAFGLFMIWQLSFNVLGHTGYEFWPRWLMKSWLGWLMNTPTNHAMHHESFRGNYGLYFNVWDRLMGTNLERYEERFGEVTSRPRAD